MKRRMAEAQTPLASVLPSLKDVDEESLYSEITLGARRVDP